ncbi:hypothetical protein ABH14_03115 [Brevibacillus brevis]|nr:hypothetical protein [Brevibacillus brevis]
MYLKNLFKRFFKWISILFFCISLIVVSFFVISIEKESNLNVDIKEKIGLISWVFSSLATIISFISFFIALTYENKLLAASKDLLRIYMPYSVETKQLREAFVNYSILIKKDRTIQLIYWIIYLVSFILIIVSGLVISIYTSFDFSFNQIVDLSVNSALYLLWTGLSVFLFGLLLIINFIRHKKNPLSSGYLPKESDVCNVNYLLNTEIDFNEFFYKNCPTIELYRNPKNKEGVSSCELYVEIPIKMSNLSYVIKVYTGNSTLLRCYGNINNYTKIGMRYRKQLSYTFEDNVFNLIREQGWGEVKVYGYQDQKYKQIARITIKKLVLDEGNQVSFVPNRTIELSSIIDNDIGLLNNMESSLEEVAYYDFTKY